MTLRRGAVILKTFKNVAAIIKNLPHLHAQAFRHEIRVCISDRCKARGGSDLLKKLQKLLKIKPGQVTKERI